MSSESLSNQYLARAFEAVVSQADFIKKIELWLISPHAAERWLQFELAYALNQAYAGQFLVGCEVNRVDFAFFDAACASPLWENEPIASAELKLFGNWYVQPNQRNGYLEDIRKVNDCRIPAMALLAFIEVGGESQRNLYDWCFKQIGTHGRQSAKESIDFLSSQTSLEQITTISSNGQASTNFASMQFHLYGYRNQLARL